MDVSLDDYIASGKVDFKTNGAKDHPTFKAQRPIDEDEEMDKEFEIWKGPSSSKNYIGLDCESDDFDTLLINAELEETVIVQTDRKKDSIAKETHNLNRPCFDLRERLNGNLPHAQSQQWRLMSPNVGSNRPPGIPPLMSINTPFPNKKYRDFRQNRRRWFNNQRNRNGGGHNNKYNNNKNGMCDGRTNRSSQSKDVDVLNKNLTSLLSHSNNTSTKTAQNITIECITESDSKCAQWNNQQQSGYDRNRCISDSDSHISKSPENTLQMQRKDDTFRSLLGLSNNFNTDMGPMLASKILDFLQCSTTTTMHKPIYDMAIQKEIHDIQGKTVSYKCPGGDVISSDGPGINCKFTPQACGRSLNNRFA